MNRVLTTVLAVALLLGLGALAVLALPGASAPLAAAPFVSAAAPDAPMAVNKYNVVAMPLEAQGQFADLGLPFKAEGLASLVGTGVQQVMSYNAAGGSFLTYVPGLGGDNFDLQVGGVYWLELDENAANVVSFVGDVPEIGSVSFSLVRPAAGGPCVYNDISIPLDRDDLATPQDLADDIGNVEQVLQWNASGSSFLQYVPGLGGDDFDVAIGYPYYVCILDGGPTTWP